MTAVPPLHGYKVLGPGRKPFHGGTGVWTPGRWRTVKPPLVPCWRGIHYCRREHLVEWLGPEVWLFEDGAPDAAVEHGRSKMVTARGRITERVDAWNDRTARLFAADCAERALMREREAGREPGGRSWRAVEVARRFADGLATDAELAAAWVAAWAAARDAARAAAWAAAWVAAWAAARDAVKDAAWDAERAWQTDRLFAYLEGRAG